MSAAQDFLHVIGHIVGHPSSVANRVGALARFGHRQLHKRLSKEPLVVTWEGLRLEVQLDAHAAAAAYYYGLYDWWELCFLDRFLRPGDHVADVGANVGVYSMFMARRVGDSGRVVAVEIDPENLRRLKANIERNGLRSVRVIAEAVGDHVGTGRFTFGRDTAGSLVEDGGGESVPLTMLDAIYAGAEPPVFVKVDVEGFELPVLNGSKGLLGQGAPLVWQLELSDGGPGRRLQDMVGVLHSFGYHFYSYDPGTKALVAQDWRRWPTNNLLAIRDPEQVVARLQG